VTPMTRKRPRRPATCTQAPTRIPPGVWAPLTEGAAPTPPAAGCSDGLPAGLVSVPTSLLVGSAPIRAPIAVASELQRWDSTMQGGLPHPPGSTGSARSLPDARDDRRRSDCLAGRAQLRKVGAHPDQVCLELSDHGQDVEEQPTDWVCRIVARRGGLLGRS
jgi:hypothetical protein